MSQTRLQRFQNYASRPNTNIKWAIAHGEHTNTALLGSIPIPEGIYVSFVSEPGKLLSKNIIYHPTFHRLHRNISLTRKFIRKEIPRYQLPSALHYFYSNNPRIYLPGQYVPNLELEFIDSDPYTNFFIGLKSLKHHSKTYTNSIVHLSDILIRPGVYFIVTCRGSTSVARNVMRQYEERLSQSLRKRPRNNISLRRNTNQPPSKKKYG